MGSAFISILILHFGFSLITSLHGEQLLQRIPADILFAVMFYSASVDLCDLVYGTLHSVGKYP